MPRRTPRVLFFLSGPLLAGLAFASPVGAQEVQWRQDYNAARKEADDKSRPLILDFGTKNCFWCKKLDASTFHEPAVAALLNDRFIPVKIDAEVESALATSLHITSYPTLVMASPDGKILGTIVGFKEAPEFTEALQRVLATLADPTWMTRDYQEASKAIAATDFARAFALLGAIGADGKERPIQVKARQLLAELEQQAADRIARAKEQDAKGLLDESIETLNGVLRVFPGSQAATEASQMLTVLAARPEIKQQQRVRKARELLAQAKDDYKTQQYLCCLDRCEVLTANYGDLPEGSEAGLLAGEIKNNPEWMKSACENLSDRLAVLQVALADTWLSKGQPQQAAACLERVVQQFPNSRQAEVANMRLAFIKGQPTMAADAKRP
jgi:thioredoxin-related protein/outer membrane protein assembly factor BamD (BamD/ComL family)